MYDIVKIKFNDLLSDITISHPHSFAWYERM